MRQIKTLILFAAVLALTLPALAHKDRKMHGKHPKASPELMASAKEMRKSEKEWAKENIPPTLLTWKQKFDNQLDPADLAALNSLRDQADALRDQIRGLRKQAVQARKAGNTEAAQQYREQIRNLFEKRHDLAHEVRPIAEKYREELKALHEEAKPTLQSWRDARAQRITEWCNRAASLAITNNDKEFIEHIRDHADKKGGFGHGHGFGHKFGDGRRAVVRFLLWNGKAELEDEHDDDEASTFGKPGTPDSTPTMRNAYPNPADAHTSITFTLPEAATATVTLYDSRGNVVSAPVKQSFTAGENTVQLPTQSLPSGSYRYSIESNGAVQTGTVQIVH